MCTLLLRIVSAGWCD
ncbi:hypothetical protein ACVHME_000982 [Shigella flexneri]|uniref:Uncharacterized protein n=1 Tax=Escherichia coli TaxID=562 RepID=A0AAW7VJ80_ECOLX|nr:MULTISPECIES: hypothetical protein [Enterobacteriaceae]MCN2195118.1 hypothetical protein [Escherichia coli]MCN6453856.1 hypothetical protein [Escherichia coli]MCN7235340.1 hypothetical protein [Escherichia coli]MDA6191228.1 hypothetical protein [Escherichia coli]MDA6331943.1 hypothetical protein [Escherichia coli]